MHHDTAYQEKILRGATPAATSWHILSQHFGRHDATFTLSLLLGKRSVTTSRF